MRLRSLGGLALEGSTFSRPKPLLLLVYLAVEGPQSRRRLADLLWMGAKNPRDVLSTTVRRLATSAPGVLRLEGDRLACGCDCDAIDLLDAGRHEAAAEVARLYSGAFLDGLGLTLGEEIEEWTFVTRERLANLARTARLSLARGALQANDARAAANHAEASLDVRHVPPWEDEDLDELVPLLRTVRSPRLGEAERLAGDLDVRIRLDPEPRATGPMPRPNLPRIGTSFVGRAHELERIERILTTPPARLLTLHGPGGIGKSRLALEAAHRIADQAGAFEAACFVPLEDVATSDRVPSAIASALGVSLAPRVPEERQLLDLVGDRRLLVVLDDYEHLTTDPSLPARILRACPHVRLLVTSRQRLNLMEEHVLPVPGLATDGAALDSDAVRLLAERVRQSDPDRSFSLADDLAAHDIARRLHGHPLALELAAAWARTLGLPRIADELARDLDLLTNHDPTATERQRSLRATFEISWRRLNEAERSALRRLAVFRGGFRLEDAEAIAGLDGAMLTRLVDKALLRPAANGRFERHPLIHQYSAAKLAEDPVLEQESRARHASHFMAAARARGDAGMGGPDVEGAWTWFAEELANLRAAWDRAVAEPDPDEEAISDVGWALAHFGEQTGRFREVREFGRSAVRGRSARIDGEAVAGASWQSMRLGEVEAAETEALRALALLQDLPSAHAFRGEWMAHEGRMGAYLTTGAFEKGLLHARKAVACAQAEIARHPLGAHPKDAEIAAGLSHTAVGWALVFLGRFDEARGAIDEAYRLTERHRSGGAVFALNLAGRNELYAGDPVAALARLQEALAAARLVGFETQEAQILCDLAQAQQVLGDLQAAEASCRSGLDITNRNGNRWHETLLHGTLGRVLCARGRTDEGLREFSAAARTGLASGMAAYAATAAAERPRPGGVRPAATARRGARSPARGTTRSTPRTRG